MFVVAMTSPWGILDQLQTWATVLQDHIDRLKINVDDLQDARHKCKYSVLEVVAKKELFFNPCLFSVCFVHDAIIIILTHSRLSLIQ